MNAPFYIVQFRTRCGCTREIQFDYERPPEVWKLPLQVSLTMIDPLSIIGDDSSTPPALGLPYREFRFLREEPMSPPWQTAGRLWRLIYEEIGTYE